MINDDFSSGIREGKSSLPFTLQAKVPSCLEAKLSQYPSCKQMRQCWAYRTSVPFRWCLDYYNMNYDHNLINIDSQYWIS